MNKLQHLQYLNLGRPSRYADNITAIQAKPSLDLNFARNKSLMDNVTGNNLVTFTRASSGTFVDSNGVLQRAVTNLLLRSEEFGTPWTLSNASVTSNAATSPNGTVTADSLIENSANSQHNISQTTTLQDNAVVTVSTYAKAFGRNWMRLSVIAKDGTVPGAYFDLSTGSTGSLISSPLATSITAVGNGWYRCSVTASVGSGVSSPGIRVWLATANNTINYTGDGTSGVYLWGAQLEQSTTVGEYIPTTSTINSAPRFDHNPLTGESLGLLVEEQRTNSIRNNTMVGAVAGTPGTLPTNWLATSTGGSITRTVVGAGTEDGINYIDIRYQFSGAANAQILTAAPNQIAASSGQNWASSFYAKLVGGSLTNIAATANIQELNAGGAPLATTVTALTPTSNGLATQRYFSTRNLNEATCAFVVQYILLAASGAADITLRIGLPQLEQGAFATSVIPTTGAAATRSADLASITGANFSSWYRQDEGTVLAEGSVVQPVTAGNQFFFRTSDNGYSNSIALNIQSTGFPSLATSAAGVFDGNASSIASLPANTAAKFIGAYAANNLGVSLNGATVATDLSATIPTTLNRLDIGSDHLGFNRIRSGIIRRLTYFPQRLSNANLQRITQ